MKAWTLSATEALERLPGPSSARWPDGERFVKALSHGSADVELYAPRDHDPQQPHTRDELYVVVAGHGRFDNGGVVTEVKSGDAIFVPAWRVHRFVEFSDDFACWAIFYGPEGGEAP